MRLQEEVLEWPFPSFDTIQSSVFPNRLEDINLNKIKNLICELNHQLLTGLTPRKSKYQQIEISLQNTDLLFEMLIKYSLVDLFYVDFTSKVSKIIIWKIQYFGVQARS